MQDTLDMQGMVDMQGEVDGNNSTIFMGIFTE